MAQGMINHDASGMQCAPRPYILRSYQTRNDFFGLSDSLKFRQRRNVNTGNTIVSVSVTKPQL